MKDNLPNPRDHTFEQFMLNMIGFKRKITTPIPGDKPWQEQVRDLYSSNSFKSNVPLPRESTGDEQADADHQKKWMMDFWDVTQNEEE